MSPPSQPARASDHAAHHREVLAAYASVVFAGALVLGALCALAWSEGGGWPTLLQAGNMGAIALGSAAALGLLRRGRDRAALLAFMVPSVVGCTWGIVHAPGPVVAVYVLGIGLLAFLGVFMIPGQRTSLAAGGWVAVYAFAIGLRLTGWVPVQSTATDAVMLVVAPAMELVILVLAGRITIGRLQEGQRRLAEINEGLEATVAERTLALRGALGEVERLLLNVLPREIADRLRGGESAIADSHADVSILFADLVGFTNIASGMDPIALVDLLNEIFSAFDELAEAHGVEKIKTIGDAYMVVGGVPSGRPDHAAAVAALALDMRLVLKRLNAERGTTLDLRIGIHTGAVVAGVIGRSKFSYDLWGDAVNVASRLESHGEAGRIQISATTQSALGAAFTTEARGMVALRGRGPVETWWLEGHA